MKDHHNRSRLFIFKNINSAPALLVLIVVILVTFIKDIRFASASVIVEEFVSDAISEAILLQWRTSSEIGNVGFYIQRSEQVSGLFNRVSPYITSDAEEGQGADYFWFDEDVQESVVYYYRLEAIDVNGGSQFAGPIPGSLNESLITSTPPSPTHTRTSGQATATRTQTSQGPSITTTQTLTSRPLFTSPTSSQFGNTQTAEVSATEAISILLTVTQQPTSALEPLPTIELLFPATETPQILPESRAQLPSSTHPISSTNEISLNEFEGTILMRYRVLFVLIGALWICLGLLLIFLIRKFSS